MKKANVEDVYRLTPIQEGMLFHALLEGEAAPYFEQFIVTYDGRLDLDRLERAWRQAVERHPVLRTSFIWEDVETPVQIVHRRVDLPIAQHDWSAIAPTGCDEELRRFLAEDRARGFALDRAPLLRLTAIRWHDATWRIVWSYHHLLLDGLSASLLMRDVGTLYQAAAALEPRRPFRDYVAWLRQQDLAAAEAWWRRTFAGCTAPAPLGIDRAPGFPVRPEDVHAVRETASTAELAAAVGDFARRNRVTLHTVIEGAWALALARFSGGAPEVVFGTTLAGRPTSLPGADAMIGCFINTLPVRVRIAPGQELLSWLRELQAAQLELRRYEHSPLVEVRRWSGLPGDRPLFEAILVFESFTPELNDGWRGDQRTNFPLTLVVWPGREIRLEARFYAGRFAAGDVDRLLAYVGELLQAFAAAPGDLRLGDLPALATTEVRQIAGWNRTDTAWDLDRLLHEQIAGQAARTPDATAAMFEHESLTYRELDARAGQLADHLCRLGVGPERLVGVVMERSLELVVALLGVLKAGGAYVPLDPGYPAGRLAAMAEDAFSGSAAPVILTQTRLIERLPASLREGGARILPLDAGRDALAGEPGEAQVSPAPADSLAYAIFTSGSTGRPKGAMNAHRGIVNRLLWMQQEYGLAADDRVLQKTPFSFDVSVWEFFWPLLTGARLVVAPPEAHRDPAWLVRLIAEHGITTVHFVPSMLQAFLDEPGIEELTGLRRVLASGEALSASLVERFFSQLPRSIELHNLYGPTEAAIDVTAWACVPGGAGAVPIGRPVSNTCIHLLDSRLDPVPVGVPGELYIGGVQVGRGYLGRPDLTAARFLPDPYTGAGGRLYATGDLARWRSDGAVEYLGRVDHQVKIRGVRIELGEIEAALAAHPGVREVVVLARNDEPGSPRLVAYVVPDTAAPVPQELREHLRLRLPEAMVPTAFVLLAALPLSPNGKVDRQALPAPERGLSGPTRVAPRNPTEEALAAVWADLLRVEIVGVEDDFFALGGDSIKAVRLVSRINAKLGATLRVPDLLQHPSVASLAVRLGAPAGRGVAEEHASGLATIDRLQQAVLANPEARRRLPDGWEDFFPLSGIEKGMIYYTLLLPDQPIYHDQYAYLLSIRDVEAFFHAFELLAGRHPTLRSTFHLDDFDEPMKVVHAHLPVSREVEDLTALSAEEQNQRLHAWRMADLRQKFAFRGERLWRLKVFRLQEELYGAVWTWHHAILDGWSNLTFWVEMNQLSGNPDLAVPEALPPLASTYKDYLAITLGRGRAPATEAFWRATLAGAGRNRLPFQRTVTGAEPAFGMRTADRLLGRDLLLDLRAQAARFGASLKTVCLAAHLHLLRVTAGEDDVVTGVVSHDRPGIPDGDRIIGCFLNTVPVRLRMPAGENGASLVRRVGRYLAAESEHEIPLVDIAALVGAREAAGNPLFDTLLNFMDYHLMEEAGGNALFRSEVTGSAHGAFDLERYEMTNTLFDVEVSATLGHFAMRIKYAPRHFEAADVERATALYQRTLEVLARDADAPLGAELLLSPAERAELVHGNDTAGAFPGELPLHAFFEKRAALHPDLPAVVCGSRSLTYGEVDRQANRLARFLLERGVQPGDNVGVCLDRSVELVVALLAVLKAAAAYVPLEPSYPAARREHIARQSAVSFLLEELPADLASFPATPVPLRPRPEDLAYTIYTSGSTGTPKGVMIEHRSAVNLIHWVNREMAVGPGDRVLMVSSICFDLSVYDVFGTLGAGGTVVIARQEEVQDPAALLRLLIGARITFWNSVPSTLGLVVQELEETAPDFRGEDLRLAFLSGDWIPLSLPDRARRLFPNLRVVSLGGATEGTVWSIWHPVERVEKGWASIPYGRPIDNNTFWVLDGNLELVPPGVVGDLYIGGDGVARGYAGDAEKTAASYRPDPFAGPGRRLYRTGDLGRSLPGGEIELLGRSDHQVKIRGYRVEPGEIESQLARCPGVRAAVVAVRTDRAGQKSLCGYVAAGPETTVEALRAQLARTLPIYMVPDVLVVLAELPLTPNGKVDRKALPAPESALGAEDRVEPAGEVECSLAEIWEEVLGTRGIGARHDFFALGGHSLAAIQVLTRVRRRFAVDLPLPDFFDDPTISGLAAAVERLRREAPAPEGPPLVRRERPELLPLSFAQERLWFLDRLQPGIAAYNVPLALGLRGRLSWPALAASLNRVVTRHESLRTTFAAVDGRPIQVVAPALHLDLPVVDLSALPAAFRQDEARRITRREAARPFHLTRGPLARATLLRLEEEHHLALFTLHHIVADGWSMGVLVREVGALYRSALRGEPAALPDLPIQYADFALWQRERLSGEALEEQIRSWRERLEGAPSLIHLPLDRPRPVVQRMRGAQTASFLPAELVGRFDAIQQAHAVTRFMALLAAFQAFLARITGQEDLVVGSPVAGRDRIETENLIGFFVNTLALRGDLAGDPSFAELLARVRRVTVEAYAHDALPFERLVEELQPERSLAYAPLFQVLLVLQNAPLPELELPGLALEPVATDPGTTKLDLTLSLSEGTRGITAQWEYDSDLFDPATIRRLQSGFEILLRGALGSPGAPLSELPLLGAEEMRQVLVEWNDTGATPPVVCLHELFAAQATRTPHALAAVDPIGGERWTYRELAQRANRMARHLRRLGVGPEVRVGVCLERSLDLLATLLGVLQAGGAYVPLDPAYPAERLAFMAEDSRATLVLTRESLLRDAARIAAESDEAPLSGAQPGHLAYIIYTSGSTGRPKGVAIEHRSAAARVAWAHRVFPAADLQGVLAATSVCFDLSVFEIFVPLCAGGTVILVPDALALGSLPETAGVTLVNTVPSAIAELARGGRIPPSVRTVNLAGEPLKGSLVREIFSSSSAERVLNLYGPSEDTTYSTWASALRDDPREPAIGRPVDGTRAYVLGRSLRPVPVGVPGELCLAGAGLSRGYLGRPELTAERFVPDPFGGRLYRTGDLARWRPDGVLELLGRLDHQVKVRGFRIELGEVEAELCRHPAVAQAVVAAEGEGESRTLVAWVVPAAEPGPEPAELREHLRACLPDFMVPAAWMLLAKLPLAPNGKVDRKALPRPERAVTAKYVAPRSGLERQLAGIWQDLLGREQVGVHDNFFDLGGHSLLMAQVQSRLAEQLGREISMVDLISHASIDALARRLAEPAGAERPEEDADRARLQAGRAEDGKARLRQMRQARRSTAGGAA